MEGKDGNQTDRDCDSTDAIEPVIWRQSFKERTLTSRKTGFGLDRIDSARFGIALVLKAMAKDTQITF